jgi:hypothetical protein
MTNTTIKSVELNFIKESYFSSKVKFIEDNMRYEVELALQTNIINRLWNDRFFDKYNAEFVTLLSYNSQPSLEDLINKGLITKEALKIYDDKAFTTYSSILYNRMEVDNPEMEKGNVMLAIRNFVKIKLTEVIATYNNSVNKINKELGK